MQLHLQQVPARNGRLWIRHGFKVFQRQPWAFSMGILTLSLCSKLLILVLPGLGTALLLAVMPLVSLGFMLATHLTLQRKRPDVATFLSPLRLTPERSRRQLLLCLLYLVGISAVMGLAYWIDGGSSERLQELMAAGKDKDAIDAAATDPRLVWSGLTFGLGMLALSVPFWHAPALVHWGGQGVAQALFSSTLALWRNKTAFLLNGLLWGALIAGWFAAMLLLAGMLGLALDPALALQITGLMLSPVYYASLYFTFVDCFMFGAPSDVLSRTDA
ncbi:MAG TPA: BPSS1780 family membrane protein [Roseateles sp.]|nr:BPSS1780 family membrane protein [Roseateles sp.]